MDSQVASFTDKLTHFLNPLDSRYEDLKKGKLGLNIFRDFAAGLIVAMVAIPLAMGFAMASGLRPEQGIIGGAVAGLIGALFGGSKYQVYGPTAAFIPVIGGIMAAYNYSFLVLASLGAGILLCLMGLSGLGKYTKHVPHSIIVGFTIGIAFVIATSQMGEVLGIKSALGKSFLEKLAGVGRYFHEMNPYAIALAGITFLFTKYLLKASIFIPAPLIAIGIGTYLSATVWSDKGLTLVKHKYGSIPTNFWVFTPPTLPTFTPALFGDLLYFILAIVFVSAVESLLCSRMADRLAGNQGTPFNPNKELWGQGLVNFVIPLFNGFPHTGALARTATNIKVGAISPLAGIFKAVLKILLAVYLASYLELVPMACIGGILMYVAVMMVKPAEVEEVLSHNRFHIALMIWTAIVVLFSDFLTGVLSGLAIYAFVCFKFPTLNEKAAMNSGIESLLRGALKFRKNGKIHQPLFSRLAKGQNPNALFIACSDSRVVPNLIADAPPGSLFTVRNVGNLVAKEAEEMQATLDFALNVLGVKDIIVCGHSNCGAMRALLAQKFPSDSLKNWISQADVDPSKFKDEDNLSRANVLQQLENLRTYSLVKDKKSKGQLKLHAWWFDIEKAEILAFDIKENRFASVEKDRLARLIQDVDSSVLRGDLIPQV